MSEKASPVMSGTQNPPKMRFPNRSVNGFGIMFYGGKPLSATTFEVTRWVTILGIPLVPLSTWEIEPTGIEEYGTRTQHKFNVVTNRPLNLKHVLLAYFLIVLSVVPPAVIWLYTTWWSSVPVMIGMTIWITLFIGMAVLKHNDMYKKARRNSNSIFSWLWRERED